ncbi:MAG TPA: ATP-binding protein, partial [Bryobacteraceae bacterium]|nr:ATP-binding protein [Bryobacteraceae bacterium]
NVLVNAVKFSPAGSHVTVDCSQVDRFARISIEDAGIGMDVATIARATEPFFQADDAMSRRNEGSGLGLAIINELVKAHSGKLEIESALGKGTRVDISIPLWSEP